MTPSFEYRKYKQLDNIELFSSVDEATYFPFHFHDYYCVSLITKGTEQLQTLNGTHFGMTGSISITQAGEVHQNSSVDPSGYSYHTLYLNPEVLAHFADKKIDLLQRNINDSKLFTGLSLLFGQKELDIQHLEKVIEGLSHYGTIVEDQKVPSFSLIDELIECEPFRTISLDQLASECCMSKFHFIRTFKKQKGITPQAYIMMKRLQKAKEMLLDGKEVREVAFLNGFYDPAHLNTAFRRFFGITLAMLKKSNIIQSSKLQ